MFQTTMGAALEARIATAVASLAIAAVMSLRCTMHSVRRDPAAPPVVPIVGGFWNRRPRHLGLSGSQVTQS